MARCVGPQQGLRKHHHEGDAALATTLHPWAQKHAQPLSSITIAMLRMISVPFLVSFTNLLSYSHVEARRVHIPCTLIP